MTINLEKQTTYGWMIATDTFLAGIGGGVFLISFILNLLHEYAPIARIGCLLGPILALVGAIFLFAELGRRNKFYMLFTNIVNRSSWLSRGAWIMTAFIIAGLAYSLSLFEPFAWLPWSRASALGQGIGVVCAILSIGLMMYPGFLFGVVSSVPFWNTPVLPILYLFSSLCCGIAVLLVTALFFRGNVRVAGFHYLGATGILFLVVLLLLIGAYVDIARHRSFVTAESLRLIKTPLIIGGVIIGGLLIPLGFLIASIFVKDIVIISILAGSGSTFLLAGGLLLRYGIIQAGTYIPLR